METNILDSLVSQAKPKIQKLIEKEMDSAEFLMQYQLIIVGIVVTTCYLMNDLSFAQRYVDIEREMIFKGFHLLTANKERLDEIIGMIRPSDTLADIVQNPLTKEIIDEVIKNIDKKL